MIPAEPRLDIPFLVMSFIAIVQTILAVYFCVKARKYKERLGNLNHLNNAPASLANNINSPKDAKTTNNQSKGKGTL
jgi:hypothetical protein